MSFREDFVAAVMVAGMAAAQGLARTATQQPPASQPTSATPSAAAPQTVTVPAGTKVLLSLKSAINTKTAQQGDGIYLISSFPVIGG